MACFSRVARGTIFPAAPLREAGAFFFDDLGIVRVVLFFILTSCAVLPSAAFALLRFAYVLLHSYAAGLGVLARFVPFENYLRVQRWPCRCADVRPSVLQESVRYPTASPNSRFGKKKLYQQNSKSSCHKSRTDSLLWTIVPKLFCKFQNEFTGELRMRRGDSNKVTNFLMAKWEYPVTWKRYESYTKLLSQIRTENAFSAPNCC